MTNRVGWVATGICHLSLCHLSLVIFESGAGLEALELRSLSAKCPRSPLQRLCRCRGSCCMNLAQQDSAGQVRATLTPLFYRRLPDLGQEFDQQAVYLLGLLVHPPK